MVYGIILQLVALTWIQNKNEYFLFKIGNLLPENIDKNRLNYFTITYYFYLELSHKNIIVIKIKYNEVNRGRFGASGTF